MRKFDTPVTPHGRNVLRAADMKSVTLKESFLKNQRDATIRLFASLDNDSLLYGFRTRAGLDAPGQSLGGCYDNDQWHIFGQLLSAYARLGYASGDDRLIGKASRLAAEWGKTLDADGYFFYSNHPKTDHYTYDKLVGGLVDLYAYTGDESAIGLLAEVTRWAADNLERTNPFACNSGKMSNTEWYTLSENLYRAYALTGDDQYRILGDEFFYSQFINYFLPYDFDRLMHAGQLTNWNRYHAYSHVNSLGGAAMAYMITGKPDLLEALVNACSFIRDTQLFATGGYGPSETLMLKNQLGETLYSEDCHFETPCGSWAVFKLCRYMMEFTGEAQYGDWAEQMIYNGIGAAFPVKDDGGVMYASNYSLHGAVKKASHHWACCAGTYPINMAEYHQQIFFVSDDEIAVNLYVPSVLRHHLHGSELILEQQMDLVRENAGRLILTLNRSCRFCLKFRRPGWCKEEIRIRINGELAPFGQEKGWLTLERTWYDGDRIDLIMPASLTVIPVEIDNNYPAAICYGPVVLAAVQQEKPEISSHKLDQLDQWLHRSEDSLLHFAGSPSEGSEVCFVSFYEIPEGEKYYMYIDPENLRIDHMALDYGPNDNCWLTNQYGHVSRQEGAFYELSFAGTGVRLTGHCFDNGANATVYIDGLRCGKINHHSPCNSIPWMWEIKNLQAGSHHLKVIAQTEAAAAGRLAINIGHVAVTKAQNTGDGSLLLAP